LELLIDVGIKVDLSGIPGRQMENDEDDGGYSQKERNRQQNAS
jgi:hypothetical protein